MSAMRLSRMPGLTRPERSSLACAHEELLQFAPGYDLHISLER